ncbi:hypothetical protein C8R43DRAFT_825599, partial [Mycena crocata]
LPAEPKIFHGRDAELKYIIEAIQRAPARIAILGAGGMGKTTLAKAALHHPSMIMKHEARYFVASDSATTSMELAAIIASHLELKPGKDLTQAVIHYLSSGGPSLLILDNLETVWDATESRGKLEKFLALL